jgi:adenine-specific DNA-methyltransferase
MAKKYTGSLSLEWFNKQKSILVQAEEAGAANGDVPAPKINWINKDEALFYEIVDDEGRGLSPFWVDRSDLRVKEARPLVFQKTYKAVERPKAGSLIDKEYKLVENNEDDAGIENMLIRGDNLLALNALKKLFASRPDEEKVKCIYIDPPYNTGQAFEHYDDNVEHSAWLTLTRDRLNILHSLLSDNGLLWIHLDDSEVHYCKLLLDETFGRHNFVAHIAYERSGAAGLGLGGYIVTTGESILLYKKNNLPDKRIMSSQKLDEKTMKRYNKYLADEGEKTLIDEFQAKSNGLPVRVYKHHGFRIGTISLAQFEAREDEIRKEFADNFDFLFRTNQIQKENEFQRSLVNKMDKQSLYTVEYIPSRGKNEGIETTLYYYNAELFAWLKDTAILNDGEIVKSSSITNFWTHAEIPKADIANEGGVDFPRGKKPEQLLRRIIDMTTEEGDLVLDCFGGSGTTFAVAQKMNRRWIGVEIGKHADTHIIPRLKRVLTGEDQSGISKAVNWQGGGSFKYYTLGDSIIDPTTRDFNWKLGRDFIEKSLLSSYDFTPDPEFSFPQAELINATQQPSIGFHRVGQRQMAGVVSLVKPKEDRPVSYDELMNWYDALKKFKGTQSITVFTNRGVEIAYESKPEDLEVIKVPHAIFAELEK